MEARRFCATANAVLPGAIMLAGKPSTEIWRLLQEGVGEETPEGDIWRFDSDGQFYGITVMGLRRRVDSDDGLTLTLPHRQRVDTSELEPVLA